MVETLVLFDIGRVLVEIDWPRLHARLARVTGYAPSEVKTRLKGTGFHAALDSGDREGFHHVVRDALGRDCLSPEFLDDAYCTIHSAPHAAVVSLKDRVRPFANVGLLSNSHAMVRTYIEERWPGTLSTGGTYNSFSDGVRSLKPEPPIYDALAGFATRTIFIDDIPENLVYPITRLGWTGIRYAALRPYGEAPDAIKGHKKYREARDAQELRDHLRDLRVLR